MTAPNCHTPSGQSGTDLRFNLLIPATISRERCDKLAAAIEQGCTTRATSSRVGGDGKPGYFAQQLNVYGREGEPCRVCGTEIKQVVLGQRSSYYCPYCQR